jgi:hypothetical protein
MYYFSLGNSTSGPVGFTAQIKAPSKKKALEMLKACFAHDNSLELARLFRSGNPDEGVQHFDVYFNTSHMSVRDIDEEETADWDEILRDEAKLGY